MANRKRIGAASGEAASVAKPRVWRSCECGEASSVAKPRLRWSRECGEAANTLEYWEGFPTGAASGEAASAVKPRVRWSRECGEAASVAKPLLRNFAHAQSTRESQRLKRLSRVSIWSLLPYETIWNKRVHLVPAAVWNNMQITEFKNIHKQLRYTLEKNY